MNEIALSVKDLKKYYGGGSQSVSTIHAVDGVSFDIRNGETLSLVGESGCGKSSVGRSILQLTPLTAGEVWLGDQRIDRLTPSKLRPMRKRLQVVFQDPFSSLNPRMTVQKIIAEPLTSFDITHGREATRARVIELLALVGLPDSALERRPHQFSGGQRQRIGIARALASDPSVIVCDEAVSALDVSVKAQIVNLLVDLQSRLGLSLLFISHDLGIVEHLSHRVAVMYLGQIVEIGTKREVFANPRHPYTRALLEAVPVPDPDFKREGIPLEGELPSPIDLPAGCRFASRCPFAFDRCRTDAPKLRAGSEGHSFACHLDELPGAASARSGLALT